MHLHDHDVSAADRKACKALVDDLPHRVSERPRRETKGGDLGAAWGDPAIVLTCGVGTPEGYQPTSPCQRVNGVGWFVPEDQISDQGKDVVMTTIDRKPNVEVVVPSEYRPPDADHGRPRRRHQEAHRRSSAPAREGAQRSPVSRSSASWTSRSTRAG